MSRDSVGLAGTTIDPYFSIWLKNWEINQINENQFSMSAKTENFSIEFLLTDQKGVIFHGANGLSQKGEEIGNASYYFSQTRLLTEGQLTVNGISYNVSGNSWMDHEFGTSTLGKNQVGWDWFSIQLENDTEIMLFQIRDRDGDISPYSSGTIISPDGSTINLSVEDFEIKPTRKWETSDQIEYPGGWDIQIKRDNIDLSISPVIPDQEMKLFFRYWEGAVVVNGFMNGEPVNGFGYVELTGYAQSMQGVF
jgi:predicted secreted hydrolase